MEKMGRQRKKSVTETNEHRHAKAQRFSVDFQIGLDGGLRDGRYVAAFGKTERLAAQFIFPRLQSIEPLTKPGLFRPVPVLIMARRRV